MRIPAGACGSHPFDSSPRRRPKTRAGQGLRFQFLAWKQTNLGEIPWDSMRFHEIPLFSCKTWRLEQWIWEIAWSSGGTCWIPLEKVTGNGRGMGKDRPRSLPFRSSTMRFRPWFVDPKWWQALLPGGLKTSILLQKTTGKNCQPNQCLPRAC